VILGSKVDVEEEKERAAVKSGMAPGLVTNVTEEEDATRLTYY
jgi:hypothetical protein